MSGLSPATPYGSANDLPSVIEIRGMLKGLKLVTRVFARAERQQLLIAEADLNRLTALVDRFYAVLGTRNWIFTDHLLSVDAVEELLAAAGSETEAESGFIEIIAERIRSPSWRFGLVRHEDLRARIVNLERARQHYLGEQWDSCTLMLVSIMDGFVNDVDKAHRRGLHARKAEEMIAWDSVSGHHMGLTSALTVFLQPFYRRYDAEVFEVHRHGIVHGTVVNYNNQIVATKAWNLLAAVTDWAESRKRTAVPPEPNTSLRELFAAFIEQGRRRRYADSFEPSTALSTDTNFDKFEVVHVVQRFLESWSNRRWALVAEALPTTRRQRVAARTRALEAKKIYESTSLEDFEINAVSFPQASVALTSGTAIVDGAPVEINIQWILERPTGYLAMPEDPDAKWVLASTPPHRFIGRQATS